MLIMNLKTKISHVKNTRLENIGSTDSNEITLTCSSSSNQVGYWEETVRQSPNNLVKIITMTPEENTARRKDLLATLEEKMGCPIIAYIANGKSESSMDKEDTLFFLDIIEQVSLKSDKVAIIINSLGGDPNAALKQLQILRNIFNGGVQVLVPYRAKSAATLLAIGADKIVMGEPSELGPIDPILVVSDLHGNHTYTQAKTYLKSIEEAKETIRSERNRHIRLAFIEKFTEQFDFAKIKRCKEAIKDFESYAREMLQKGTMRGRTQEEIGNTIHTLMDGETHHDHASLINAAEASGKLKLNIEFWGIHDEKWKALWEYFELAENISNLAGIAKLFESKSASIITLQKQAKPNAAFKPPSADDLKREQRQDNQKEENIEVTPITINSIRK